MTDCERWAEKLDAYVDGELPAGEARELDVHLRGCASCAADGLRKTQLKLAVQNAGKRFTADPAFRERMLRSIAVPKTTRWNGGWLPIFAAATAVAFLIAGALLLTLKRDRASDQQLVSELVDQHVATLASSNPVDVVSTDRHTVKPWFEGKIPFTFNLPELEGSPFVLVGGRV
jgi:anti-sigma factor RsiW